MAARAAVVLSLHCTVLHDNRPEGGGWRGLAVLGLAAIQISLKVVDLMKGTYIEVQIQYQKHKNYFWASTKSLILKCICTRAVSVGQPYREPILMMYFGFCLPSINI